MERLPSPDVVVIGGGIVGTSAAAFLAEAGASVVLVERSAIAAGASGRNSGALQQPLDGPLGELYRRTVELYRELGEAEGDGAGSAAAADVRFALPRAPAGLLLVAPEREGVEAELAAVQAGENGWPASLRPEVVEPAELVRREPALAPDVWALRLDTGYPIVPGAATLSFARRAQRAGVALIVGETARPYLSGSRIGGVELGSMARLRAGRVLVAAGPWSREVVPSWSSRPPIAASWGVVVSVALSEPPSAILEEVGIDLQATVPAAFSLVTAAGVSSVGSTFLPDEPDPAALADAILERAARFVPRLAAASRVAFRSCARPVSFDGRPLVGPVDGRDGLFVCAGHGPWGISTGPASAEAVVDEMLGRQPKLSPTTRRALLPSRWQA